MYVCRLCLHLQGFSPSCFEISNFSTTLACTINKNKDKCCCTVSINTDSIETGRGGGGVWWLSLFLVSATRALANPAHVACLRKVGCAGGRNFPVGIRMFLTEKKVLSFFQGESEFFFMVGKSRNKCFFLQVRREAREAFRLYARSKKKVVTAAFRERMYI